jgi:hypothetical protein
VNDANEQRDMVVDGCLVSDGSSGSERCSRVLLEMMKGNESFKEDKKQRVSIDAAQL